MQSAPAQRLYYLDVLKILCLTFVFLFHCFKIFGAESWHIKNGELLRRNMRREFLTEEELNDHLRLKGIDDVKEVKAAYIEGDGKISVVKHKRKG